MPRSSVFPLEYKILSDWHEISNTPPVPENLQTCNWFKVTATIVKYSQEQDIFT